MTSIRVTFGALGVRNYRLYFAGHTVSDVGTWMQKIGQAWLVLELTGSGIWLGVVAAIQQAPMLLAAPWGGILADRFDKRRLLVVTQTGAGLLALSLGVLTASGLVELWVVLVLALGLGTINALDKPARHTFVSEMVGRGQLTNAVTLNSVVGNAGKIGGPALAGLVIGAFGLAANFLTNAVSYLAVVIVLVLMRRDELYPPERIPRARGQFRAGLRYVRGAPHLLGPLVLMTVAGLLAFEWSVTIPLLARDAFAGGADVFGLMFSAKGVGAVIGGLVVAGRMTVSAGHLAHLSWIFGGLVVAAAAAPSLPSVLVMFLGVGAASIALRACAMSFLQLVSDPPMRGRVMALLLMALGGTTPVGAPLVGWLAETHGPRVAIAIGGASTALAGVVTHLYLRRRGEVG